jgi:dipeptidyl aminopeptidase/acylaminoacyl peptidase
VSVLASGQGGRRFRFVDDVAVARDGMVYFTEASDRHPVADYELEIIEHRPRGRVLSYDPRTTQVAIVAAGFYFANGIALGPDDAYLLVTETSSYRIRRVWLAGERRGAVEPWVDNLPGFPDNIRWSPDRRVFWVALGAPRDRMLDRLAGHPFLREIIARLPAFLQPAPKRHTFALAFGEDGALRHDLQATGGSAYAPVASVLEWQGRLYLGSFRAHGIASAPAPGMQR